MGQISVEIYDSPGSVLSGNQQAWQHDYNHYRPHSSLGNLTPAEMAAK